QDRTTRLHSDREYIKDLPEHIPTRSALIYPTPLHNWMKGKGLCVCGWQSRLSLLGFQFFFQLAQNHIALKAGEVIHEGYAVEVIHLMLKADSEQAVRLELPQLPIFIDITNGDGIRPFYFGILAGKG